MTISAASQEHGFKYNEFINCLNRSNVKLDRKILAELAVNEPYSFKAVIDEVQLQTGYDKEYKQSRKLKTQRGMLYEEALETGRMRPGGPPTAEELEEIRKLMIPAQI